jgi:hypothetical protein
MLLLLLHMLPLLLLLLAGLASIATLTQLTALHIIQGPSARWPLPAGQLSRLSSLTALQSLSTDAGAPHDKVAWAGTGLEGQAEQQAQLQSQQWSVALACMQQLTRLDLVYVVLCDELLITIGNAAPQLRELSLDLGEKDFAATASAAGAAAVAHIQRIELVWTKSLEYSTIQYNCAPPVKPQKKVAGMQAHRSIPAAA